MKRSVPEKTSDDKIIARVLEGHANAFEELLAKYQAHVMKIVGRHIPHDRVQEVAHDVFVRAYKSLPTFKNEGSFTAWLSSVAVRTCYDYWRKQYRNREFPMSSLSENHQEWIQKTLSDRSGDTYNREASQKEAREVLSWAMEKMTPEEKMIIELIHLQELSGKEAATLLGWSVANVKIKAYRSRKKLRKILLELSDAGETRA